MPSGQIDYQINAAIVFSFRLWVETHPAFFLSLAIFMSENNRKGLQKNLSINTAMLRCTVAQESQKMPRHLETICKKKILKNSCWIQQFLYLISAVSCIV